MYQEHFLRVANESLVTEFSLESWFDPLDGFMPDMELDKSDCKIVQIIHSSALYNPNISMETTLTLNLGTAFKSGHYDF